MPKIDLTEEERDAVTGILLGAQMSGSAAYTEDARSAMVKIRDAIRDAHDDPSAVSDGARVRLNVIRSPSMIVVKAASSVAECAWFDEAGNVRRETFPIACLALDPPST